MTDSGSVPPFGAFAPNAFQKRVIDFTRGRQDSWMGRRLAFAARRLVLSRLRTPLDVDVFGNRMRLVPFNNVCEKRILFTPQFFDAEERLILKGRLGPNATFIDIGANVGAYALFVAGIADRGARILAIEPQPAIFDRLAYNVGQNASGSIKAIACAVADREGELTLFLDEENQGESSVKIVASSARGSPSVTVPAKTLLAILQEEGLDRVDGLKIDVEGAEDLILVAFFRDAPKQLWPRLMIIENGADRWQTDCIALARQHGYTLIAQTPLNFVLERAGAESGQA